MMMVVKSVNSESECGASPALARGTFWDVLWASVAYNPALNLYNL